MWPASIRATDQSRRAISRATVRPPSPPPITHTSTSRSNVNFGKRGTATAVRAYHVAARSGGAIVSAVLSFAMRRLMLLRHAKSDRPPGVADHDRPLNRRGARDAGVVGTYL